jgi:hypothetical protein
MITKAKAVIKDKFWIVEQNGNKVGTISSDEGRYVLSSKEGVRVFDSKTQLERKLGKTVFEGTEQKPEVSAEKTACGYPTSAVPYNVIYDVKRKIPLFTKSTSSTSMYCAGYFVLHFNKGWVKSFCPKLNTIEEYEFRGPFKTQLEMKQEMSRVKK